ncbi:MAG TPA: polymer-forming cytoskeletal protein, partial [Gemmatimonadaceae bacterium]|nr:polymer-forming cytoskeletal protein [Gemmatimonadaceae bacterium]
MRNRWMLVGAALLATTMPGARTARGQDPPPGQPAQQKPQAPDARTLPREVADELLAVWNAPATLRVDGPYTIEAGRDVAGDVGVLGGTLTVSGHVRGRVVAVNADVRLTSGARVDGEILVVGGRVTGGDVATVGGQIRTYRARLVYARDGDRLSPRRDTAESPRPWWRRNER